MGSATIHHDLLGVTITNGYGRVSACSCGWTSALVPAARNKRGGMNKDQTAAEESAKGLHRAHVRNLRPSSARGARP